MTGDRPALDVYLTFDVEFWPDGGRMDPRSIGEAVDRDIYGLTPGGEFGLRFMLEQLGRRGLIGSFLVESLHAEVVGRGPLHRMVDRILHAHQEVQLHVHTEWGRGLAGDECSLFEYSEEAQRVMIGLALANLRAVGAGEISAFRAGNYGANLATLRALAHHGLRVDTSYNRCMARDGQWDGLDRPFERARAMDGVLEVPVTSFQDRPNNHRHAQLGACSTREMHDMLEQAWRHGHQTFVIVLHSFELLDRRNRRVDPIVLKRFLALCDLLDSQRERYRTCRLADLSPAHGDAQAPEPTPLRSSLHRTAGRLAEQLLRRATGLVPSRPTSAPHPKHLPYRPGPATAGARTHH